MLTPRRREHATHQLTNWGRDPSYPQAQWKSRFLAWTARRRAGELAVPCDGCVVNCEVGQFIEIDKIVNVADNRVAVEFAVGRVNFHGHAMRRKEHRRLYV